MKGQDQKGFQRTPGQSKGVKNQETDKGRIERPMGSRLGMLALSQEQWEIIKSGLVLFGFEVERW